MTTTTTTTKGTPMNTTPTTPAGLAQFDHLPPAEAVARAWTTPGPHAAWHRAAQDEVRRTMPVLTRALDRLAQGGAR